MREKKVNVFSKNKDISQRKTKDCFLLKMYDFRIPFQRLFLAKVKLELKWTEMH